MLTTVTIALAVVSLLLFVALTLLSVSYVKMEQRAEEAEHEESRLRFELIDIQRYVSETVRPPRPRS
jgi:heme/copper-type cytochrome/quinol oxidase subunit 2